MHSNRKLSVVRSTLKCAVIDLQYKAVLKEQRLVAQIISKESENLRFKYVAHAIIIRFLSSQFNNP